jgi:hypothetical protein
MSQYHATWDRLNGVHKKFLSISSTNTTASELVEVMPLILLEFRHETRYVHVMPSAVISTTYIINISH